MTANITYLFLTATQVKRLYNKYLGRSSLVQPTMLESALDSPMNHKSYGQTDLFQLAGVLAEKVILNHPYQDGNKRTALFAADMCLKINGYELQKKPMENDENDPDLNQGLTDAHVSVATSQWSSEDLGRSKPLGSMSEEVRAYHEDAVKW